MTERSECGVRQIRADAATGSRHNQLPAPDDRILAAAVQMNSQPDLERNMEQVRVDVARAAREGARLVRCRRISRTWAASWASTGGRTASPKRCWSRSRRWPASSGCLAGGFPVRTGLPEPTDSVGRMVAREPDNPRSRTFNRAIVAGPVGRHHRAVRQDPPVRHHPFRRGAVPRIVPGGAGNPWCATEAVVCDHSIWCASASPSATMCAFPSSTGA
jgi:hypothetical protein